MSITRTGALYVATTLLLGFAAVNTGNNLLYLLVSILLGFMATSGLLGWLNIRWLDCSVRFPDELYSGRPTQVTIRLTNLKPRLPSYLLRIQLLGASCSLTVVNGGATQATSFLHTFSGRGRHAAGAARICSPFPVNFFVRCVEIDCDGEAVAFPAPAAATHAPFSVRDGSSGEIQRTERGIDGDMLTIADYTGTEPLKMIHWRLSARHEGFKVKELGTARNEPVIIDLTAAAALPLEERLSFAAHQINHFSRENRAVGLKLAAGRTIPAASGRSHRLRLLTELALYDATQPAA
ncbi:MAG: DUF58 domain-containing protein [Geobacter sp.]|nr:DUF58 domain-containing protein [Geobacter sp.]